MTSSITPHRKLDSAFLDALEELAIEPTGNWWRDVLAHKDLVLAVRDNYINAYYRGCSIFLIEWKSGQIKPSTHIKYLVRPKQSYVTLKGGNFQFAAETALQGPYQGSNTLKEMCDSAENYAGPEKTGLHPMLIGNANVIDVEIAMTRQRASESIEDEGNPGSSKRKLDRIDAAIAVYEDDMPTIRFYEAKHFTNSDLRAKGDNPPKVFRQIAGYEKALEEHKGQLSAGYVEAAKALLRFNDMRIRAFGASGARTVSPVIRKIAEADTGQVPVIDTLPHLLIFGFDDAQKYDKAWKDGHLKKLEQELQGRVRDVGKPTRKNKFNR